MTTEEARLDPFMAAILIANGQLEDPNAKTLTRDGRPVGPPKMTTLDQKAALGFGLTPGALPFECLYVDPGIPSWRTDPGIAHLVERRTALESRLRDLRAGRPPRPPKSDGGRFARIAGLLGDREKVKAAQAREAEIIEALAAARAADDEETALGTQIAELAEAIRIRTVDAKAVERDEIHAAGVELLRKFVIALDRANAANNAWLSLRRFAAADFVDAARLPDDLGWPELSRRGDIGFTLTEAMNGGGRIDRWRAIAYRWLERGRQ